MYFYSEIVDELLKEFPEIRGRYTEELAWIRDTFQDQETRGQTIYFDRCCKKLPGQPTKDAIPYFPGQ